MILQGTHLIAGSSSADSPATFTACNPATGQAISPAFHEATPAEIDRACRAAEQAAGELRAKSQQDKAALLRAIADGLMELGDALVQRTCDETGLPRARIEGERGRTCNQLRLFADVVEEGSWVDARIDRALPQRQPVPRPDLRRMLVPIGPVAVFGASNFPLAFSVAGGDTASALAAGCPVVCKAHPAHPGASEMAARVIDSAIERCGMPPGAFSLLQGAGPEVGASLVRHRAIKAVGFTGSLRAGRALFDEASRRPEPIPVYAEMGSTNPVFLLPGALRQGGDKLADGLVASVTLGVGQFCTKPGLIFLPGGSEMGVRGSVGLLLDRVQFLIESAAAGTMLHAGIQRQFQSAAARLAGIAGVETRVGGAEKSAPNIAGPPCAQKPLLFCTTAGHLLENPAIAEEVFGPSTILVTAQTRDELLAAARSLSGHLTATIHGAPEELSQWRDLLTILEEKVGRLIFNGWPTGVEVCHAMQHGGPWPAATDSRSTSVGAAAILRWARPVCWQNFPDASLPPELQDSNPLKIWRQIDGLPTRDSAPQ